MKSIRLLLGGSFDPVHQGHLRVAHTVADASGQTVFLLPTSQSPFKAGAHASAEHRLAMLQLAIAEQASLAVDTFELQQTGVHYTIATWRHFQALQIAPVFIVGWDAFASLERWHEGETLIANAHFIVLARDGEHDELSSSLQQRWQMRQKLSADTLQSVRASEHGQTFFCPMEKIELSSSAIRCELAEGRQPAGLPKAVYHYIEQHQLYRQPLAG